MPLCATLCSPVPCQQYDHEVLSSRYKLYILINVPGLVRINNVIALGFINLYMTYGS